MKPILIFLFIIFLFLQPLFAQRTDSLQKVIAAANKDVEEAKAINALASEYMRTDLAKAKTYLYNAISLSKQIGSEVQLSSAYVQLVSVHHNGGRSDSALIYLEKLKRLTLQPGNKDNKSILGNYYATAGLYYKKTGNLKQAITFIKKSVAIAEQDGNKTSIAGQLINLGNTYNLLGDYKSALLQQLRALKLFEEEKNLKGQSFCYQNISNSFIEMKQFKNALSYALKSLEIKKSINDTRGICTAEMGLGQIYNGLGKYAEALTHYSNAMTIASNLKLTSEQAKINYNIAKTYIEKKDSINAVSYLNKSRQMAEQLGDSSITSSVQLELTALQTKKQSLPLSEKTLLSSIEKMQRSGQLPKEAVGYQRIAEIFAANQQYDKALEYTKKFYDYRDSINNNELLMQVKKIEEQYNLDKKEKEIAILKKDQLLQQAQIEKQKLYQTGGAVFLVLMVFIAILIINRYRTVQKNRQLLAMEKMRNGIARDLHDDIGSTLTSINILSKVMLQETSRNNSVQTQNLLKIKEHSSSIMDSMSDIVWAINPHNDTVEKVIFKMKEFASEVLDPLNIAFNFLVEGDFSQARLTLDKRKDLYLIFKEAVNNAAKYSNCDKVNIILKHAEGNINLQVNDNGCGFDEQKVKYGNGVRNIRERAKNMLASLTYNTSSGNGTDIQLSIPLT